MKQKLLESLRTKFSGINDVVLDRIATKLAKTVTDEAGVDTAVAGVTFQQIIESEADRRATEASQSAIANYEKKYSLKDGKSIEATPPPNPSGSSDEAPSWAKSLLESHKKVEDRINAIENEKVATFRKAKISELIKDLPEGLQKPYNRVDVVCFSDEQFDKYLEEVKADVGDISKEMSSKGASFGVPPSGGTPNNTQPSDKDVEMIVNSIV